MALELESRRDGKIRDPDRFTVRHPLELSIFNQILEGLRNPFDLHLPSQLPSESRSSVSSLKTALLE